MTAGPYTATAGLVSRFAGAWCRAVPADPLRQFEYEAGLLAADDQTGVDTAWLREQLDMPSDIAG